MEGEEWQTISAPTLEEAELIGLARLGALREEVEIQVIDEGKKGFLGLGSRPAEIRIRLRVPRMGRAAATKARPELQASAPSAEGAVSSASRPEGEMPSAKATQRSEAKAPAVEAAQRSEAKAPAAEAVQRSGAKAPAAEAVQRSEAKAPAAEAAQRSEAKAPAAEAVQRSEAKAPAAEAAPREEKRAAASAKPRREPAPAGETEKKSRRERRRGAEEAETPAAQNETAARLVQSAGPEGEMPTTTGAASAAEVIILEEAHKLLAGFKVQMTLKPAEDESGTLVLRIHGRDARALVGRDAHVMESVQHLLRLLVQRRAPEAPEVVVDADGYWERHDRKLRELAKRTADEVAKTGRPVRLRPMPARDRRVIHVALRLDPRVTTESQGSGKQRAVVVSPVREA